jgi:hypothetical protein
MVLALQICIFWSWSFYRVYVPLVQLESYLTNTFSVFPIFGAVSPQTAALPLMFILAVTAIKDAIEDYRRATLDEEVNTSAATKLGNWHNINQPKDPRNWLERLLGLNAPGHVTKGVRKLREREASEGFKNHTQPCRKSPSVSVTDPSSLSLDGGSGKRLEDIQSVDSHSYPPFGRDNPPQPSFSASAQNLVGNASSATLTAASSSGVVDWSKRISGSARWERTLWKKLEVGDVVLLRDNEQVPADIASSFLRPIPMGYAISRPRTLMAKPISSHAKLSTPRRPYSLKKIWNARPSFWTQSPHTLICIFTTEYFAFEIRSLTSRKPSQSQSTRCSSVVARFAILLG